MQRGRRRITVVAPSVVAPDAPTLTAPADGSVAVSGSGVTVSATVTAGQVPDRIDFVLNPGVGEVVVATDSSSPYSATWTVTQAIGFHTLVARFVYGSGSVDSSAISVGINAAAPKVWLRGDRGLTIATGVSDWADQSGNGNNAVQATGTKQPTVTASAIGGQQGLTSDGIDDFMAITGVDLSGGLVATLLVVEKDTNAGQVCLVEPDPDIDAAAAGIALWTAGVNDIRVWALGSTSARKRADSVLGVGRSSGALLSHRMDAAAAAGSEMEFRQNGGAATTLSWLNGEATESTGNLGNKNYNLFGRPASSFFAGTICEIMLFPEALSVAQQQAICDYVEDRYGIVMTAVA